MNNKTYVWWGHRKFEVTQRMISLLRRLPVKTMDVPKNLRVFSKLEEAGLAQYDNKEYPTVWWRLTLKGHNFMEESKADQKEKGRTKD